MGQKQNEAPSFFPRGPAPHDHQPLIQHVAQLINPIHDRLNALMMREQRAQNMPAGVVPISNDEPAPPAVGAAEPAAALVSSSSASASPKPHSLFHALHGLTKVALLRVVHRIGTVHGYSRLNKDDLIQLLATEHPEETMRVIASYSAE